MRFIVVGCDGRRSTEWKIWSLRSDVYLTSDAAPEAKVSLHESGHCYFRHDSHHKTYHAAETGRAFPIRGLHWERPPVTDQNGAVSAIYLRFFPADFLTYETAPRPSSAKNPAVHVVAPGGASEMVVGVYFKCDDHGLVAPDETLGVVGDPQKIYEHELNNGESIEALIWSAETNGEARAAVLAQRSSAESAKRLGLAHRRLIRKSKRGRVINTPISREGVISALSAFRFEHGRVELMESRGGRPDIPIGDHADT